MWEIILQLHKGGSASSTSNTVSEWKPNAYQQEVAGNSGDENTVMGNLMGNQGYMNTSAVLRNAATDQLNAYNNSGLGKYNYATDLSNAQAQIGAAQAGYGNLANGVMPSQFQTNMENSIRSGVQNTMGNTLNNLANRGVLNSSVANQAMNDISKNAANTMAEQYSSNIESLGNIYNAQINAAPASMNAASTAQGNQYTSSLDMLNAGIGAYNTASSILGLGGTTSNVQSNRGGGGAVNAVAGLAGGVLGAFCFPAETGILMADGTEKDIADVKVGDIVITVGDSDYFEHNEVLETQEPREEKLFKVTCVDRQGQINFVEASETQPFMDVNRKWVELKELKVGDTLLGVGKVKSVEPTRTALVYDLLVEKNNNYIADGFVAHGAYK